MNKYVFIISERGCRTNIMSDFEVISIEKLITYLKEDIQIWKNENDKEKWRKLHILKGWRTGLRVACIDNSNFQTRLFKYINLEEFEDIFKGHIKEIEPLLEYGHLRYSYFKKEILNKYGIKKENANE